MNLDIDCKEMSHLISSGQDGELSPANRSRRQMHLVMCATCRNVEEQMDFLRRAMRELEQHDAPPNP